MFKWNDEDKIRLGIVYLFLASGNRISNADFVLFEEVGKSVKWFPNVKGEIVGECEKILTPPDDSKSRFEIVSDFFSSYKTSDGSKPHIVWASEAKTSGGSDTNRNCDILWTLQYLQYCRIKEESEKKQQLVNLWAEANGIDNSVVLMMRDICETQNAIIEFQKWLEASKGMTYQEVNSIMQELDKDLKNLQQSVSDLIALG
jgi:hypothetical protein